MGYFLMGMLACAFFFVCGFGAWRMYQQSRGPTEEENRQERRLTALEEQLTQVYHRAAQLENLVQYMDDGLLAVDGSGTVVLINRRAREFLNLEGLTAGEKASGSIALARVADIMQKARQSQAPQHETISLVAGQERILNVYATSLKEANAPDTVLAVLTDVTQIKKLEQMRTDFVANVTHELKTPLTAIRGYIELLKDKERDETTRAYFYDVLDIEAERLQNLIGDLLGLSEIESGRDEGRAEPIEVAEQIEIAKKHLAQEAQKYGVEVSIEVPDPVMITVSAFRFQQLLCNLMENAIKYNKTGGRVDVSAHAARGVLYIQVADTGIGLADADKARIFERFYRVDKSRSRATGGTGLGLSIVKHIVGLYGGDVSVESTLGEGSTFTVRLPLSQNNQD